MNEMERFKIVMKAIANNCKSEEIKDELNNIIKDEEILKYIMKEIRYATFNDNISNALKEYIELNDIDSELLNNKILKEF